MYTEALGSVTRLKYEEVYYTQHVFVILGVLATQNFPFSEQNYTQCWVINPSMVAAGFYLVQVGYLLQISSFPHQKEAGNVILKIHAKKNRGSDSDYRNINLLSPDHKGHI